MKISIVIFPLLALTGCALSPPPPPAVEGEYKPINKIESMPLAIATQPNRLSQQTLDFAFEGDIVAALHELQKQRPDITVLPPLGEQRTVLVRVNFQAATLDEVLRELGAQSGPYADVIVSKSVTNEGNHVFIRFNTVNTGR